MKIVTGIAPAIPLRIIVVILDPIQSTSNPVIIASTGVNPSRHVPITGNEHGVVPTNGSDFQSEEQSGSC